MRCFIVIPAFNEERRLGRVLADLRRNGYTDIVVVDDASRDATARLARSAGALVLRHPRNRGQGAALRTGIAEALRRGADVIVTFDADGQHRASEIARLLKPIADGRADVVLGSRFLGNAPGIPWYKRFTLKGALFVERLLLGVRLTDVHNGLRALSRPAARVMRLSVDRMGHASEIVYELRLRGLRYVEAPVTIVYDAYAKDKGQSVFNAFRILHEILQMKRAKRSPRPQRA